MHVQRVVVPGNQAESWTVLDDDGRVVEPVERWLAHLTAIERSPNTVKAYSHDLKDYLVFLASRGLDWRVVRLEDIGAFVAWLRLPAEGRDGSVARRRTAVASPWGPTRHSSTWRSGSAPSMKS